MLQTVEQFMVSPLNTQSIVLILLGLLIAILLGFTIAYVYFLKKNNRLTIENTELKTRVELEKAQHEDKIKMLENARDDLADSFAALSQIALKDNSEAFLKLAQEKLTQFQLTAKNDLTAREVAIENLVKPITETLQNTEKQLHSIEKERKEAYGSLTKHLETMAQTQQLLYGETRNLVQALKRPEVRGQWGELTLRRLAELAGMVEHCDFTEQPSTTTDTGLLRPDMIVRMPDSREIVVDVKTPLDAYLNAVEASTDELRDQALRRHAKNVRERVRELSAKSYWNQFKHAPDFVVLFIPGDQFLSSALDMDHKLLEDALVNKVILATPTSLVALLRAVAYGWRQTELDKNADKIRELGEELYARIATFTEHLYRLSKHITGSVDSFNKAVGSLESKVLPGAKKLAELGVQSKKNIPAVEPIDRITRKSENG